MVRVGPTCDRSTLSMRDRFSFGIERVRRMQLLNGWDDIDLTDRRRSEITNYRERRATGQRWIWPGGGPP